MTILKSHRSSILLGILLCPISGAASFSRAAPLGGTSTTLKGKSDNCSTKIRHHHHPAFKSCRCRRSKQYLSKQGQPSPSTIILKATTDISGGDSDDRDDDGKQDESSSSAAVMKGRTTLCLVALLYGTLNVSLRLIYQLPEPPTASALSAARGVLACVGFLPLLLLPNKSKDGDVAASSTPSSTTTTQSTTTTALVVAGLELAFWNFLAQGLLNIGLLSTSSARASFLTQTSVVFTPVLSRLFGQRVPSNVWAACGIALVGLTVLSTAAGAGAAAGGGGSFLSSLIHFGTGDWLVLGGALSWSMYLFRISSIGSKFREINLQFVKTSLLAVLYMIWSVASIVMNSTGGATAATATGSFVSQFLTQPYGWMLNGAAFFVLLYSAIGPGTVADILQQQGQKEVSASEANVILSLEPVFTALCAWLVLGELTSMQEAVGGAIILSAALVATR